MKSNDISRVDHKLKTMKLKENLLKECRVMVSFAISSGKGVDALQIAPLHKDDDEVRGQDLIPVYNYLVNLVKPATPGTLVLFEKNRQSTKRFKFLGPLPIVRQFMLLSIFSLLALILISLSPDVNAHSIQLSMLQGQGVDQIERLAFLLACASVGASFYALFKMNTYINQGTFNMKYSATYWSRFVLGLVAGVLLSELFVVFINPEVSTQEITAKDGLDETSMLNSANYLLKPILAILGGFSASLVYRILNRLIEAVESIFKGSSTQAIHQVQQRMAMEAQENEQRIKSMAAQQVFALKSTLLNGGADEATMNKVDETLEQLTTMNHHAGRANSDSGVNIADLSAVMNQGLPQEEPTAEAEEQNTPDEQPSESDKPKGGTTSNW